MYLYNCVHLQYIQVCMCKRVIRTCCYKEHLRDICRNMFCIRQYLSKIKKKEKRMKNGICVLFKSHTCTCIWKKVEHSFAIFLFHAILGLDLQFKPIFFNFFLWYGKDYLNTLYIQKKKERANFLAIPSLSVQFCPFPVYPGWQSHKCDPLVLVQFAFSWQEWFPLHSSMSIKPQIKKILKKWDFEIMQKFLCISHYRV